MDLTQHSSIPAFQYSNDPHSMKFEELKSLDLQKCATVGDVVDGMKWCAFGARMLGEVAKTIYEMIASRKKPILIYSGLPDSPLGLLLQKFVDNKWCGKIILPSEYARQRNQEERAIFINQFDLARPGQIKDGYFPDAVFADPRYVMPVLYRTLEEWIDGKRSVMATLMADLAAYGGVASQVSRGAQALQSMVKDKNCLRFLTISGAMTVGKMDLVICDMIESGMVHAISSTGALMAHGLVSSVGLKHYKYNRKYNDTELAKHKLNRVTDTLETETNLNTVA